MALIYNGSEVNSLIYNGNSTVGVWNGSVVWGEPTIDPYNPLGLPANTIRVKFSNGYTPTMGDSQTLVDADNNVWDIYKENNIWNNFFMSGSETPPRNNTTVLEVLGANTTNITSMKYMFARNISLTSVALFDTTNVTSMFDMFVNCSSLQTAPLFNTSNVTNMNYMFQRCYSLSSIPLFDTSKVINMDATFSTCSSLTYIPLFDTTNVTSMGNTFANCFNVQSGALALYQQASTQANPPTSHTKTFSACGINTQTGLEELQQIPTGWGGTGA